MYDIYLAVEIMFYAHGWICLWALQISKKYKFDSENPSNGLYSNLQQPHSSQLFQNLLWSQYPHGHSLYLHSTTLKDCVVYALCPILK